MKIWGKGFQRLDETDFELYLVDDITAADQFVHIFEKKGWGYIPKLSKIVYTDGKLIVISKRKVVDGSCVEVKYALDGSSWFLKYEKNSLQLYVKLNYEGNIITDNKEIDCFLDKHYRQVREVIISKKRFAQNASKLAFQLNLPFEIVMALKGDKYNLDKFVATVEKAIEHCFYADRTNMQNLISKSYQVRQRALEYIGIYVPENCLVNSFKIGRYVYDCLDERKIIRNK